MPAATRIGDADISHCSGMTRAEGSPNVFVNGIAWSRQGDNNTSHLIPSATPCPSHAAPIATGSSTVKVNTKGDAVSVFAHQCFGDFPALVMIFFRNIIKCLPV